MPQCGLRQPRKFAIHLESVLDHSLLLAVTTSLKIIVSGMSLFLFFVESCACSFNLEAKQLAASVIAALFVKILPNFSVARSSVSKCLCFAYADSMLSVLLKLTCIVVRSGVYCFS